MPSGNTVQQHQCGKQETVRSMVTDCAQCILTQL